MGQCEKEVEIKEKSMKQAHKTLMYDITEETRVNR